MDAAFRDRYPTSASQIEWFRLCHKKWALNKLFGHKPPDNKYAGRGKKCHSTLEDWQKGKEIDFETEEGTIVFPALRFLPAPGTHQTEHDFIFRTESATYRGTKDLRSPTDSPVRAVWDYKTTGDFKWLKGIEKLRRDVQGNLYSVSEIIESGEQLERVELNWLNILYNVKKPRARKVQLHVLPEGSEVPKRQKDVRSKDFGHMYYPELFERFEEIEETSREILRYRAMHLSGEITDPTDVPYDVEGCDQFGGCPYKNVVCKLTISQKIAAKEAKMKLSERIKENNDQQPPKKADPKPESKPVSGTKPSEAARASAQEVKDKAAKKPPATNPPENGKGVDPDAPVGAVRAGASDRMGIAVEVLKAVVSSRLYAVTEDPSAVDKATKLSVQLADSLVRSLAK